MRSVSVGADVRAARRQRLGWAGRCGGLEWGRGTTPQFGVEMGVWRSATKAGAGAQRGGGSRGQGRQWPRVGVDVRM